MNYWIIKARPDRNDVRRLPSAGKLDMWYTTRLPQDWSQDDLLLVWAGAPMLRIIAIADLMRPDAGFRQGYNHFLIKYRTGFLDGPGLRELRSDHIVRSASFLKAGPSGTVFPLTPKQGRHLLELLQDQGQPIANEKSREAQPDRHQELAVVRLLGQGFGSAAENRRIERSGIAATSRYFRTHGWRVTSVERERIGYDLRCIKAREELHVEAKGIRGSAISFTLTAGEYRRAIADPAFRIATVTRVLTKPSILLHTGPQLIRDFRMAPLAYKVVPSRRKLSRPVAVLRV